jgi:hypothetical protein
MNYLTNYYKNLCEQLQEQISLLEARINRPTHTVLGDTFRNDQEMDRRVNQRMDVMSDLDALVNFDGADEDTRLAASRVLQDMESTNKQFGRVGTQASGADLRAAIGGLKAIGQTPGFQAHRSKRLSGAADTGVGFTDYKSDWVGGKMYTKTDIGSGYRGVDMVLGSYDDPDNPFVDTQKAQRMVAMNVGGAMSPQGLEKVRIGTRIVDRADKTAKLGFRSSEEPIMGGRVQPFTGRASEFRQGLNQPNVQDVLTALEPQLKRDPGSVAREFPGGFERTVLSSYGFPEYANMLARRKQQ